MSGIFDNCSLCATITNIWNTFIEAVSSCFSQVYQFFSASFAKVYPTTNENLSKEALKKIYWGLGKDNKWREYIDGVYHYLNDKYCFDKELMAVQSNLVSSAVWKRLYIH